MYRRKSYDFRCQSIDFRPIAIQPPFCYANLMSTPVIQAEAQPDPTAVEIRRHMRDWRFWLLPRPVVLMTSLLYLLVLVFWFDQQISISWSLRLISFVFWELGLQGAAILGCLVALLVIDRIDYWIWGEHPPQHALIGLFALRLILIESVARLMSTRIVGGIATPDPWLPLYLYCVVPYMAASYWVPSASYGLAALVWLLAVSRFMPYQQELASFLFARNGLLEAISLYSFVLLLTAAIAGIVSNERRSRITAEHLLAELQRSHAHLSRAAAEALALTEERNHLARAIHDSLGQVLAVINVQLDKALAYRPFDAVSADQAVRDAKQVGREALQEVRRSVATLRVSRPVMILPSPPIWARVPQQRWRLSNWLMPRKFELLPTLWYIGWLVFFLRNTALPGIDFLSPELRGIVVVAVVALLAVDRLALRLWGEAPSTRVSLVLIVIRLLLLAIIGQAAGLWYALFLLPLVPYLGFLVGGSRGGLLTAGLTLMTITVLGLRILDAQNTVASLAFGLGMLSFFLLLVITTLSAVLNDRAHRLRAERVMHDLEEAHAGLKRSATETLQATEERNQLARDIHDSLGHYLTVINVQLEKSLAFRTRDPDIADRALGDAKRIASDALRDVRSALGVLEPTHELFSLTAGLQRLAYNVGDGVPVELRVIGQEDSFSRQALMVLYRVAQEGLTNIQKHARAAQARIELVFADEQATLTVQDNGRGFDPDDQATPVMARQYGLQCMRERLELVGGSFTLTSQPGAGTRIVVVVPRQALAQWSSDSIAEEHLL